MVDRKEGRARKKKFKIVIHQFQNAHVTIERLAPWYTSAARETFNSLVDYLSEFHAHPNQTLPSVLVPAISRSPGVTVEETLPEEDQRKYYHFVFEAIKT